MSDDLCILRDALGWLLVSAGALAIVVLATGGNAPAEPGPGYLPGVWQRSTESVYQAGLLAAVIAIIPHFLWVVLRRDRHRMGDAYDRFAAWGQTVLTSLGFLGTVVGISLAVGGLEAAMREDEPGRLIAGLSTAFDTTFLGLVGAIMLLVLRKLVSLGAVQ